jgi:N-hydroxyarylamine O-acetyltransferase
VLRPIELRDGAEDDHGGWRYRVRRVRTPGSGPAWELHRHRDGGWEPMHTTDDLPVHPVDLAMGHHWTSTWPGSHFRRGLMLTRHGDGVHTSLTHASVTVRRPGAPTEHRPLREGELLDRLHELRAGLTDAEAHHLVQLARGL